MKELVHRMLFETRPGEWLLWLLERAFGLAVVEAEDLKEETAK